MANPDLFKRGAVTYPLPAATTNALLVDADPSLSSMLEFFAHVLDKHLGARLKAQAALHGIVIAHAVGKTLAVEPTPDILAEHFRFPMLCIWRVKDADARITLSWDNDASELRFAYVLPLLTAVQKIALLPILRSVGRVVARYVKLGTDPDFRGGQLVWKTAGIQQLTLREFQYGVLEAMDQEAGAYRALTGSLEITERDAFAEGARDPFEGGDASIGVTGRDGDAAPVAELSTHPPPSVTNVVPNVGSKAGGTTIVVKGTGYHPGQPARVIVGKREAKNVVVLDETNIRCVTPPADTPSTLLADVTVVNFDGQRARLPAAFTFTTP